MVEQGWRPTAVARTTLIVLGLTLLTYLLWQGRDILFVLFFGVLIGVFLSVFTGWVEGRGLNRLVALALVVLAVAALTAGFWILLWPTLTAQLSTVGRELPEALQRVAEWVQGQYRAVLGSGGGGAGGIEEELRERLGDQVGTILGGAMPVINSAAGAVAGALVVLVVGIYTAARPRLYREGFLSLFPPTYRGRIGDTLRRAERTLRGWMIGTLINMVLVSVLVFLGLWILDVPAALALAVIAGMFEFIPFIGPILAAVPAIVVALTVSPVTALWVAGLYIVIQQVEGDVIMPLVMRGAARLPPALTVVFQAFMAVIFGFPGLLLAVPILVVVMVAVQALYIEPMEQAAGVGSGIAQHD